VSNHAIEDAYFMETEPPNKMTKKDKIPRKRADNSRSKGKPKVPKKDRKSLPEPAVRKRDMDSSDLSTDFKSDHDKGWDKSLEQAQKYVAFGKKRPNFEDLKSPEEEKEEGDIQEPSEPDAGILYSKNFPAYKEATIDKYHAAKAKQHIRAFTVEIVRKPIQRDSTGSFWQRKPFDYSDYERDLPQTYSTRIRTQDLTFADRSRRCAKDGVSVDSRKPWHEKHSDWEMRIGVKMTNPDVTFDRISHNEKCELAEKSNGQKWLHYTPHEHHYLALTLKTEK